MSDDIDKINEIFRIHDERVRNAQNTGKHTANVRVGENTGKHTEGVRAGENTGTHKRSAPLKAMDKLLLDRSGEEKSNYTGDDESERDYRPVRQSHEYRSGCLGGLMYFTFIACVSIIFACLAWMAASDMLALNKEEFTTTVTLPSSVFQSETVDKFDDNGRKTGTKRITHADMDYVSDVLKDAGLIEYKWLFELFCKVSTADEKVSPGEYELKSSYDYRALIQHMRAGSSSTVTVTVTIPEGFSMHQIFMRLEENGVCSYNDLMESAENDLFNYSFLEGNESRGAYRLEGFLFPDTYEFYVGMQASSAINKLLDNCNKKITEEILTRINDMGMTLYDVISVASLIEKEAANDAERPLISSVIYNRLNIGIVLGIDASVLYPYPEHEGAPTKQMLEKDDPYNTRINPGLPPTPICNPGIASITAALYPESTNYYFYALDTESGTHQFFTEDTDFNSFVATQNYE